MDDIKQQETLKQLFNLISGGKKKKLEYSTVQTIYQHFKDHWVFLYQYIQYLLLFFNTR